MTQEITLFKNLGLATPTSVTFSHNLNALVGAGYTSMAGNTYFNALRMAEGLLIKEDIGEGYAHTFLNGLHIYDIRTKTLICEKTFHCKLYSRIISKQCAVTMLTNMIEQTAAKDHKLLNRIEVQKTVSEIVNRAFFGNQIYEIQRTLKQLNA